MTAFIGKMIFVSEYQGKIFTRAGVRAGKLVDL